MAKTHTEYVCQNCGRTSPRLMGRCPKCGEYNTMVAVVVEPPKAASRRRAGAPRSVPQRLTEVSKDAEPRVALPLEEFSRVLGGGVVPGSLVLLGGDPGIGKSTLLLQVSALLAEHAGPALYVSGEESPRQIKMRADRLGVKPEDLYLVTETDLDVILGHVEALQPRLLIVDSIQTTYLSDLSSAAGSVSQVRECAARLQTLAKTGGVSVFLIGHVTKEGTIAGPRVLEHIVDTVLYLEGDRYQSYRLLRCVKNRFGATAEVGVFEMRSTGMVEVPNPSEAFLAERVVNAPGSAIAVTLEGTRPLLVELQGLTSPTTFGNPRRTPNGVDFNRLLLITAVLTRRAGLKLGDQDVFVNVIGGLKIDEPAADLAVAAAIASSSRERPVVADLVMVGEIGLSGELRAVSQLPLRLREAAKLGFRKAIVPKTVRPGEPYPDGIEIVAARSIREALDAALVKSDGT
jgi:DNA repair protein RadA/Sms